MSLLGSELVTNGAFADDSGFTKTGGFTIADGHAIYTHDAGAGTLYPTTALSIVAGKSYVVAAEVSDWSITGSLTLSVGGTTVATITEADDISDTIVSATTGNLLISVTSSAGTTLYIDNLTVKEISVADTVEKALFDLLRLNTTVSALTSTRVYPQTIPQNTTYPAIRYNQISGIRDHTLTDTVEMVHARFQIDCYGTSYSNARTLADAVRSALDNYYGGVGSVAIQCIHLIDEGDSFDEVVGVDQLKRYGKTQDYTIWYND